MEEREAKIMSEVAEGDLSAFRELVELHQKSLLNFIARFIGDKTGAEDMAQEVFIRVFKSARGYTPQSKFKTWLFKIATNLCLNKIRDNKHQPQLVDLFELNEAGFIAIAPDTYSPERALEYRELRDVIKNALKKLPKNQRIALLLQKYNGFSYNEISQIMGYSVAAVESLIQRARQNLRKMLALYL
jgi:RNA polymerase sigma-70 factor (ECF subfamily)